MRMDLRRRVHQGGQDFHYDVVIVFESSDESKMIDEAFGSNVDPDGLIARVVGEVRLSDSIGDHYLLLQPVKR